MNKQLIYGYDESGMTHQPRVIYDGNPELSYDLYWDANGNLAQVVQCKQEQARFHLWDDNNRLSAVIGPKQAGFYGYNGNGDRVWKPTANRTNACICSSVPRRLATRAQRESKLTGLCQIDNQNGGEMSYSALLDDAVLYPNPYLTITPAGYTKHYYIGSERIATAIGEGGWGNALVNKDQHDAEISTAFFKRYENDLPCEQYQVTANHDIAGEYREEIQYNCNPKCLRYLKLNYAYDYLAKCINTYSKTLNQEKTFFTHSDHLGSASWITYSGGYPVQYIHYAPYGELIANQNAYGSSYDERYKFTGKERDAESGYDYYGARYQIVPLGIWGSPDPLLDKYIYISPYMYCNGNPIVLKDPDGRWVHVVVGAGVGAIVGACIALNSGKSGQDVGIAALGGAVAGTITAVTGGLGGSSIVLSTLFGTGGGMIGGAAGNLTEQGMKIALGSQSSVDVDEVGSATVAGAVAGAVGGLAKGLISKGAGALKQIVGKNYKNPSVEKSFKKKVATELKSSGKKASAKSVNKIAAERMENSQKIDEVIIDGTKEYLNVVNQVSTPNIENDIKN